MTYTREEKRFTILLDDKNMWLHELAGNKQKTVNFLIKKSLVAKTRTTRKPKKIFSKERLCSPTNSS